MARVLPDRHTVCLHAHIQLEPEHISICVFHGALVAHSGKTKGSYPQETATSRTTQDVDYLTVVCCGLLYKQDS